MKKSYDEIRKEMNNYIRTKNLSKLKKLIKDYPKYELLRFEYAKLLASTNINGNLEKATSIFLKLLPKYKVSVSYELSKIARATGDFAKQSMYLEEILPLLDDIYKSLYIFYDLASSYVYQKRYDEAIEILNYILQMAPNHRGAYLNLGSIYITLKEYEKAYEVLSKLDRNTLDFEFKKRYDETMLFLSKTLNVYDLNFAYNNLTYVGEQIVSYSSKKALNHIKEHLEEVEDGENTTRFNTGVNLSELMTEVKEELTEENFLKGYLLDNYVIKKSNIGYEGESYLRVVTIPHTKDIITMYPCHNYFKYYPNKISQEEIEIKSNVRVRK